MIKKILILLCVNIVYIQGMHVEDIAQHLQTIYQQLVPLSNQPTNCSPLSPSLTEGSEDNCAICFDALSAQPTVDLHPEEIIPHTFHYDCIYDMTKEKKEFACPFDRRPLSRAILYKNDECFLCRKKYVETPQLAFVVAHPDHQFHTFCLAEYIKKDQYCPLCTHEFIQAENCISKLSLLGNMRMGISQFGLGLIEGTKLYTDVTRGFFGLGFFPYVSYEFGRSLCSIPAFFISHLATNQTNRTLLLKPISTTVQTGLLLSLGYKNEFIQVNTHSFIEKFLYNIPHDLINKLNKKCDKDYELRKFYWSKDKTKKYCKWAGYTAGLLITGNIAQKTLDMGSIIALEASKKLISAYLSKNT